MHVTGKSIQTVCAVIWGLVIGLIFLFHRIPTEGDGKVFWTIVGVLVVGAAVGVVGLAAVKTVGDAVSPEWIDRWWDPPPDK